MLVLCYEYDRISLMQRGEYAIVEKIGLSVVG